MAKPIWTQQQQPDPPNFGEAELVSLPVLNQEVNARQETCRKIIANTSRSGSFEKGLVSLAILSCKRLEALKRLCNTLMPFFRNVETYRPIEFTLVDNGSGKELLDYARSLDFFTDIVAYEKNLGMIGALRPVFPKLRGEYILLLEDDFIVDYSKPFLANCMEIFDEYPEIGIIRLKNLNNWGKKHRRIAPLRSTSKGTEFWTWLPSGRNADAPPAGTPEGREYDRMRKEKGLPIEGVWNGWCAGSVIFRKVSYLSTGELPVGENVTRNNPKNQGSLYEEIYGAEYNKHWLAAKMKNCYPFSQPNDEAECPGWGEVVQ